MSDTNWADAVNGRGKDLPKRTSPDGRGRYVWINKPDTKFDKEGVYKTDLIVDPEADGFEELQAEIDEAMAAAKAKAEEQFAAMTKAKQKKKDNAVEQQGEPIEDEFDDDDNETGNKVLSFKAKASGKKKDGGRWKRTIPIFDAKGKKSKAQVFPGSILAVGFRIKPWTNATNNYGVKLELNAVQVIELASGGGTAEDHGFAARDDGYDAANEKGADEDEDEDDLEDDADSDDEEDDDEAEF